MNASVFRPSVVKDEDGRTCLRFPVVDSFAARKMAAKLKPDVRYMLSVEKEKKPRSNDQNRLMWELCQRIAEAIDAKRNEVYREIIRDYGDYVTVRVSRADAALVSNEWQAKGIGWITECESADGDDLVLRLYQGSSTYDTAQMTRVINALMDECRTLDIDVDDGRVASLLAEN